MNKIGMSLFTKTQLNFHNMIQKLGLCFVGALVHKEPIFLYVNVTIKLEIFIGPVNILVFIPCHNNEVL